MRALIIIDMQNDFMSQGSLEVPGAEQLIPIINELTAQFDCVIASQDWHPLDHMSFASTHGKKAGEKIYANGQTQILWPKHCIEHTFGAEIVKGLHTEAIDRYFYKGENPNIDSYSAFFDNYRSQSTGLAEYLKERGIAEVYLAGVALDYCVLYSALDGIDLGFSVFVIPNACRPIHFESGQSALETIAAKGGKIL